MQPIEAQQHSNTSRQALSQSGNSFKLFSTLANVELALQKRSQEQREQLVENLPKLADQLPSLAKEYVTIAGELSAVLPNQFESFTQPVGAANDPAEGE